MKRSKHFFPLPNILLKNNEESFSICKLLIEICNIFTNHFERWAPRFSERKGWTSVYFEPDPDFESSSIPFDIFHNSTPNSPPSSQNPMISLFSSQSSSEDDKNRPKSYVSIPTNEEEDEFDEIPDELLMQNAEYDEDYEEQDEEEYFEEQEEEENKAEEVRVTKDKSAQPGIDELELDEFDGIDIQPVEPLIEAEDFDEIEEEIEDIESYFS